MTSHTRRVVEDDDFELLERVCHADRSACATGALGR